ncbi:MAG: ferritin family protein [Candidatus Omnitrophica bacterium]|nr:ferritin family protein [Candidatus Omnitrophota bacterium]
MKIEERGDQFIIVDFNEREAYTIACRIEEEGIRFYGKLLEAVADPQAKGVIEHLIREERRHLAFFTECLSVLEEGGDEGFEEDTLLKNIDFGIFQPYEAMGDLGQIVDNLKKALRLGIAVENKSIQLYETCQGRISDPATREELKRIACEEAKHAAALEKILNAV